MVGRATTTLLPFIAWNFSLYLTLGFPSGMALARKRKQRTSWMTSDNILTSHRTAHLLSIFTFTTVYNSSTRKVSIWEPSLVTMCGHYHMRSSFRPDLQHPYFNLLCNAFQRHYRDGAVQSIYNLWDGQYLRLIAYSASLLSYLCCQILRKGWRRRTAPWLKKSHRTLMLRERLFRGTSALSYKSLTTYESQS